MLNSVILISFPLVFGYRIQMLSCTNVDLVQEVGDVVLNMTDSGVPPVNLKPYVVENRVRTGKEVLGEQYSLQNFAFSFIVHVFIR